MGMMVKFRPRSVETPVTMSDLVRAVRMRLKVRPVEARSIVLRVFREIREAVARGEKVELRGIGTFSRKVSKPRWGRDFRQRRPVRVPGSARVGFKISRKLRARLRDTNGSAP